MASLVLKTAHEPTHSVVDWFVEIQSSISVQLYKYINFKYLNFHCRYNPESFSSLLNRQQINPNK